ncbi:uncharacterized protein ISCGN_015672 [Ixodes scapularis]
MPPPSQAPPKGQSFVFSAPAEVPVDEIIDSLYGLAGEDSLTHLQHFGAMKFLAAVGSTEAADKMVAQGHLLLRSFVVPLEQAGPRIFSVTVFRLPPYAPTTPSKQSSVLTGSHATTDCTQRRSYSAVIRDEGPSYPRPPPLTAPNPPDSTPGAPPQPVETHPTAGVTQPDAPQVLALRCVLDILEDVDYIGRTLMLCWLGRLRRTLGPRGLGNLAPAAETPQPHYAAVVATQRRVTQELPGVHIQQLPVSRACESLCAAEVSLAHQSRSSQVSWESLVSADVPAQAADTGWKFGWRVLPTRDRLAHWGVAATDSRPNCPSIESNEHALVGCVVARTFWRLVARVFGRAAPPLVCGAVTPTQQRTVPSVGHTPLWPTQREPLDPTSHRRVPQARAPLFLRSSVTIWTPPSVCGIVPWPQVTRPPVTHRVSFPLSPLPPSSRPMCFLWKPLCKPSSVTAATPPTAPAQVTAATPPTAPAQVTAAPTIAPAQAAGAALPVVPTQDDAAASPDGLDFQESDVADSSHSPGRLVISDDTDLTPGQREPSARSELSPSTQRESSKFSSSDEGEDRGDAKRTFPSTSSGSDGPIASTVKKKRSEPHDSDEDYSLTF